MGVRFLGIGRGKARSKARVKRANEERGLAQAALDASIGALRSTAGDARQRATLSADDLYGPQMQRATDSVRANANNTKMALSRAASATGGDVTGGQGVVFDRVDTGANTEIGRVLDGYENRADFERTRNLRRADQLLSSIAGLNSNQFQIADQNFNTQTMLELQRQQANKQLGADIFSTILDVIPKPGGG